jgi:plastocyanin
MLMSITALAGLVLLAATVEAGGGGHGGCPNPPREGAGDTISIENNCFQTAVLYVEPGDNVTWTNLDQQAHNVTFLDGSRAEEKDTFYFDESATTTFDDAGLYPYFCSIHPGMFGVIAAGDSVSPGVISHTSAKLEVAPKVEPPTATRASSSGSGLSPAFAGVVVLTGLVSASGGFWLRRRRD